MYGVENYIHLGAYPAQAVLGLGSASAKFLGAGMVHFGPVRLILLVIWIYMCMYSVLRIEFNPTVPVRYKPYVNILALFVGPWILFLLLVVDTAKKAQEGNLAFAEAFKEVLRNTFNRSLRECSSKPELPIKLLDSSGRDFSEVYGGSDDSALANEMLHLTQQIILDGINDRASDILIDPKSNDMYTIRFRIDGLLSTVNEIESDRCVAVVNSIKAISGMDIAERRRPQDGAFMAKLLDGNVFFRVASAGVLGGEKLSIRVLNQSTGLLGLESIGFADELLSSVLNAVSQSSGMIIVCGPTGSGKTTTLYAMLGEIDFLTRNVVTVEDPVEYVLPQASQIEVNVKADITFANALRSIVRQDPDVICVGEIRDAETASMALQASQTGHLVLATLHSSSNMASLVRLMELGVKPMLLSAALNVIVSQRLVRVLCEDCKSPAELSAEWIKQFEKSKWDHTKFMQANGCKSCHGTGYRGRTAICDVTVLTDNLKAKLLDRNLSHGDMKKDGDVSGRSTLRTEGLKKALTGITSIEEVQRVTSNLG